MATTPCDMMKQFVSMLLLTPLLGTAVNSAEQSGPNPGNLTPAGSQSVSLFTGAFTYSYPIAVPPGRQGIQPDLNLIYNSQANNGWLGVGWDLSVGSIQRSTKNGAPTYNDGQDTFLLQFQGKSDQLVPVGTGSDSTGSYTEYRAQIESVFLRIRYYAPGTWQIWSKDGKKYLFRGLAQNTSVSGNPYFYWGLSQVIDPMGNYMQINYPPLSGASGNVPSNGHFAAMAVSGVGGAVSYTPTSILYTGNSIQGDAPTNEIDFGYESRPTDQLSSYTAGFQQQLLSRLTSITIKANNAAVRTYTLGYSPSEVGISRLASITVSGSDGSSMPATTFGYQTNASYGTAPSASFLPPTNFVGRYQAQSSVGDGTLMVDVNGDGLPDIIQAYSGSGGSAFHAWLNTGNGWQSADSPWNSPVRMFDMVANVGAVDEGVRFVDLNGDGLVDIIQGETSPMNGYNVRQAWLNNGHGWTIAPQWVPPMDIVTRPSLSWSYVNGVQFVDLNNDGLPDIVQYMTGSGGTVANVWLNTGNGWQSANSWLPPVRLMDLVANAGSVDEGVRFVDLNGDGLVDIIQGETSPMSGYNLRQAWLNNGHGWTAAPQWNPPTDIVVRPTWGMSYLNGVELVDINGDGLPDIVQDMSGSGGTAANVWLNTGNGWKSDNSWLPPARLMDLVANVGTVDEGLRLEDLNGDGLVDIIQSQASTNIPSYDLHRALLAQGGPENILTSINNGLGGITQISYGPPGQYGASLPFPVTVVKSITSSDGMGNPAVTTAYSYSGGFYDSTRQNREFLGFNLVTATQMSATGASISQTVTHFLQNDDAATAGGVNLYKGKIAEQDINDASGNLLTKTVNTYSFSIPYSGAKVYFPFLSETDSYIGSKHVASQYQYDVYGNVIQEKDLGDVNDATDDKTISTEYSANTSAYLVGYPIHKKIVKADGTTVVSESWFTYDNNSNYTQNPSIGLMTKSESWLNGGNDPILSMAYDAYGNLTDQYDALWNATGGSQGNHLHKIYDSTYHQFPSFVTQGAGSFNFTDAYSFDPGTGQMLSHLDVNQSSTTYQYDTFGRLSMVINPADSLVLPTVQYQYTINSSPPHSIVSTARVISGSTNTLTTYMFFDGLGRKCETKSDGPGRTQVVSDFNTYDDRGMVSKAYLPYTAPSVSASYLPEDASKAYALSQYDALGRVVQLIHPDGTSTSKSYTDWTETDTDPNGHSKSYDKDAYGRIGRVTENNAGNQYFTTYQYDTLGNLTGITNSLGQSTVLSYDSLSRKTAMSDPQMGSWQYQYDADSNLTRQIDAKGQATLMIYDGLGRLASKTYPDSSSITYVYDSGNNAKGRISSVNDLSGSTRFIYDNLGRVISKQRTLSGSTYTTQMAYDDLGREISVIYPDNNVTQSLYDAGQLSSVKDPQSGTTFATLAYDPLAVGKISSVAYGNGVTTAYQYNISAIGQANNFYLHSLITRNSSSQILQNFGYTYDNVGNIMSITDPVGGMNQTFQYDDLNRLTQALGLYGTKSYQYDSFGNLTADQDNTAGSYGFDDTSAVTSIQGSIYGTTNGRLGNGLYFDGNSAAQLNGSQSLSPAQALTVEFWVRPLQLGTTNGYILSKQGSYGFTTTTSTGGLNVQINLASGLKTISVPNALFYNIWSHLALTYDGSVIKVYVNGQVAASQSGSGPILTSQSPVQLGAQFNGILDEIVILPRALPAAEVLLDYQSAPKLLPNQPLTPTPMQAGQVSGQRNTNYGFQFAAWDLNGDQVKYRIDWGTGAVAYPETGYVPSGMVVVASNSWVQASTVPYSIRMQTVELTNGATSSWSPAFNLLIAPAIVTQLSGIPLIGASAGVSSSSSNTIQNTVGEWVVSTSSSSQYRASFGYQNPISGASPWWAVALGAQGPGGINVTSPDKQTISSFVNLAGTTTADVSQIALGLRQNGYSQVQDANGNMQMGGNRWIKYDFENRPIRIITPDGTTTDFVYDYEGSRVQKTITPPSGSPQTSIYVGQIYEVTASSTIEYITAGSLRVAMRDQTGNVTYFLPDHLGSTNILTDANQTILRYTQYTPFGSTYQTSGSQDSDFKFTGQRLDDTTGLYYYGARYYDPLIGRFITPDTIIQRPYDPQTLNRYTYCRNNPLKFTDPTGHDFEHKAMAWWGRTFDTHHLDQFFQRNNMSIDGGGGCNSNGGCAAGTADNPTGNIKSGGSASNSSPTNYEQYDPQPSLLGNLVGESMRPLDLYELPFTTPAEPGPLYLYPSYSENKNFDYAMLEYAEKYVKEKTVDLKGTLGIDVGYAFVNTYNYAGFQEGKGFVKGIDSSLTTSLVGADINLSVSVRSYGDTLTTSFGASKYMSIGMTQDISGKGGIFGLVGFSASYGPGVGIPGVNWSYGGDSPEQKR